MLLAGGPQAGQHGEMCRYQWLLRVDSVLRADPRAPRCAAVIMRRSRAPRQDAGAAMPREAWWRLTPEWLLVRRDYPGRQPRRDHIPRLQPIPLGQQLRGKPLALAEPFDFDRDGFDGELDAFDACVLRTFAASPGGDPDDGRARWIRHQLNTAPGPSNKTESVS